MPTGFAPLRVWCLLLGLAVLVAVWLGPLPALSATHFVAHMTMHVLVVALAAPLLAAGLADSPWDPAARHPWLFAAVPASLLELVVVWGFHAPALHHLARHTSGMLLVEQGSFLLSSFAVWMSALGGGSGARAGAGTAALLMTSMHMALLGALLATATRPLYGHGDDPVSALDQQHAGGVVMLVGGGTSYLLGGLWRLAQLLSSPKPRGS